jgi:hypothetical protein
MACTIYEVYDVISWNKICANSFGDLSFNNIAHGVGADFLVFTL